MSRKNDKLMLIRTLLTDMGNKTVEGLRKSMGALYSFDAELATMARNYESEIDQMYHEANEECIITIATQQPAASDMRLVVASYKVVGEIERIADYSNKIGKIVQKHLAKRDRQPFDSILEAVRVLGGTTVQMLADAICAYSYNDIELAKSVIERDKMVDIMSKQLYQELLILTVEQPDLIRPVIELHRVIRQVERAADRTTNIAEWTYYIATGQRTHGNGGG